MYFRYDDANDVWTYAKHGNKEGFVPTSYIELLSDQAEASDDSTSPQPREPEVEPGLEK